MGVNAVSEKRPVFTIGAGTPVMRAAPKVSMPADELLISSRDPLHLGKTPAAGNGLGKMVFGGLLGSLGLVGFTAAAMEAAGAGGALAAIAGFLGLATIPAWLAFGLPIVSGALILGGLAMIIWGHRERVEEESVRIALDTDPKPKW